MKKLFILLGIVLVFGGCSLTPKEMQADIKECKDLGLGIKVHKTIYQNIFNISCCPINSEGCQHIITEESL